MSDITSDVRPVPGYDGFFAASDGTILYAAAAGYPRPVPTYTRGQKYAMIALNKSQTGQPQRMVTAHSLVLFAFEGPRPPHQEARHLDGNPRNNAASNLKWGTQSENAQDAVRHGTCSTLRTGSRHPRAKMTEAQAIDALDRIANGEPAKAIAAELGIAQSTLSEIKSGHKWPHLDRTHLRTRSSAPAHQGEAQHDNPCSDDPSHDTSKIRLSTGDEVGGGGFLTNPMTPATGRPSRDCSRKMQPRVSQSRQDQ